LTVKLSEPCSVWFCNPVCLIPREDICWKLAWSCPADT
jgi:hypothetical protein